MRSLFTRLVVILTTGCLAVGISPAVGAATPSVSKLTLSDLRWQPAAKRLNVSAQLSGAGNWTMTLVDACTSTQVRKLTGSLSQAGEIAFTVDGTVAPLIADGTYSVSLTAKSQSGAIGNTVSAELSVGDLVTSVASEVPICLNAKRLTLQPSALGQIAAAAISAANDFPNTKTVYLLSAKADPLFSAVAANSAAMRKRPVLLTEKAKLSYRAKTDLARRGATKVVILGSPESVSNTVVSQLQKLGYQVVRKSATTAIGLAQALYVANSAIDSAVLVDSTALGDTLLQATAFSTASRRWLIPYSQSDLTSTKGLLKKLGVKQSTALSATTLSGLTSVGKVDPTNPVSSSLALARSVSADTSRLFLLGQGARATTAALVTLASPRLYLTVPSGGLTAAQRSWLNSRGDIQFVESISNLKPIKDSTIAGVGRLIAARGEPTDIPVLSPAPLDALKAPATFAFSGSGYGHGVGLSQWGAYQLATEGKTATEILNFYYPGTTVEPRMSAQEVSVNLLNLEVTSSQPAPTVDLKLMPVGSSKPSWRLKAKIDGTWQNFDLKLGQLLRVTLATGSNQLVFEVLGNNPINIPKAAVAKLIWSGTRTQGELGDAAGVIKVVGGDLNRQYREGWMGLKAAAKTQTGSYAKRLQVTSRVRLADEYLYGISEVSSSWPMAALEAQVVAARSYVYNDVYASDGSRNSLSSVCDCDVYDGTQDQVYVGWAKVSGAQGERWQAAVDATFTEDGMAKVVTYGKKVVQAFFSASTGGYTQNIEDVWGGGAAPYFKSVADPWSLLPSAAAGYSRWEPRVRAQKVVAAAFGLSAVATLDFSDRFASGALRTVTATAPDGTEKTITGEQFRTRVRSGAGLSSDTPLPSTWVWRTAIEPRITGARLASTDLFADGWLENTKASAALAKTAVLVTQTKSNDGGIFAAAAAYAGRRGLPLIAVAADGDEFRIRTFLQEHSITEAVLVGEVDSVISDKLELANISTRQIYGETAAEIAAELAQELGTDRAVFFDTSETSAWPLAVSAAVRWGAALIPVSETELAPELAAVLDGNPPSSVLAVGATTGLPDRLLSGWQKPSRVNTADLAIASRVVLTLSTSINRSVVLASPTTDLESQLVGASLGFPMLYLDEANQAMNLAWLRRQSLLSGVVLLGAEADLAIEFRRA